MSVAIAVENFKHYLKNDPDLARGTAYLNQEATGCQVAAKFTDGNFKCWMDGYEFGDRPQILHPVTWNDKFAGESE